MSKIVLMQKLDEPVSGYWDGGTKKIFEWEVDEMRSKYWYSKGKAIVGSWDANLFFPVKYKKGDTDIDILKKAKSILKRRMTKYKVTGSFKLSELR